MILIGLGGNRPYDNFSSAETLLAAIDSLDNLPGLAIVARSSLWSSTAWPDPSQPQYVNAVIRLKADIEPEDLMSVLLAVERNYGRDRSVETRWGSRTLDLDLLDFNGLQLEGHNLTLPHPRLHERAFVLKPLLEIAPDWMHPVYGAGRDLLARLASRESEDVTQLRKPVSPTHKQP